MEELRTLCFDLGIDFDDLRGEGKSNRARELVALMERHKRISELVAEVKTLRPDSELITEIEKICTDRRGFGKVVTPPPIHIPDPAHIVWVDPPPIDSITPPVPPFLELVNDPVVKPPIKARLDHLRTRLQAGQWQQADTETFQVLLIIAEQAEDGWLRSNDIEQLPCEVLQQIDMLWREASNNRFGWSVQLCILYNTLNKRGRRTPEIGRPGRFTSENIRALGDHVGWRVDDEWRKNYSELQFSLDAPVGHLPSLRSSRFDQTDTWLETWKDALKNFLGHMNTCSPIHTIT
jgi:hypothetical protein